MGEKVAYYGEEGAECGILALAPVYIYPLIRACDASKLPCARLKTPVKNVIAPGTVWLIEAISS
jgi:hypothetical protein